MSKNKNTRTWQQRISVFLGILLVIATVAGAFLPIIQNSIASSQPLVSPTDTPVPTVPAPPDTALINFEQAYLHPSGLFTAAIPSGWTVTSEINNTGEALVTMQNPSALSVVEVRVIRPTSDIDLSSLESMGAYFDAEWLSQSWRQYTSPREDQRRIDAEKNQLVMDFTLTQRGQTYAASQVAYTDGTWIYTVRVVAPSNATTALQYVLENEVASVKPLTVYVGKELEWFGHFDNVNKFMVRFPSTWSLVDSAAGAPTSITTANVQARFEAAALGINSTEAASSYVSGLRSGVTVLSVNEVTVNGVAGYRVAYTLSTLDGASQSGWVQILDNGTNNFIANILFSNLADTDLNTVDLAAVDVNPSILEASKVLDSIALFPELSVE